MELFHGVQLAIAAMPDEKDFTKTALADFSNDFVLCYAHGVAFLSYVLELSEKLFFAQFKAGLFVDVALARSELDSGHGLFTIVVEHEEVAVVDLYLAFCQALFVRNVARRVVAAGGMESEGAGSGGGRV